MYIKKLLLQRETIFKQCRTIGSVALFFVFCLPIQVMAQNQNQTQPTNKSSVLTKGLNPGATRVSDPWSQNTIWIDQYTAQNKELTTVKQDDGSDVIVFNFKESSSTLDHNYMNNARSLAVLDQIFSDPEMQKKVDITVITGSASPEGNTTSNNKLASDRALAIKSYIMWKHPNMNRDRIATYSIGEDWAGFKELITNDHNVPLRSEVLDVLNRSMNNDQKMRKLQQIGNGETYNYLKTNIFPNLRGGVSCTFYHIESEKPAPVIEYRDRVVEKTLTDTVFVKNTEYITTEVDKRPIRYIAVKTNMLYDLVLLPNLAIEVSLGKRWSMEAEGMLSWWESTNSNRYSHRIQTGGLELRKWLGNSSKTPLTGHYLGLYGMGGTYDVKVSKEKGYLSNGSYSFGVSYGYSMPVSRRLNLEFGIGVGYLGGEYSIYDYNENHERYEREGIEQKSYFGPTKAKVSLVWLIGSGVNNK